MLTACNKDWTPESGLDQTDEITVRFSKAPMHTLRTKADSINANEEDDTIDRLDVYVYDNKDTVLVNHHVFTDASGVDLSSIDVKYYDVSGTTLYFFALANLAGMQIGGMLFTASFAIIPTIFIAVFTKNHPLHKIIIHNRLVSYFDLVSFGRHIGVVRFPNEVGDVV